MIPKLFTRRDFLKLSSVTALSLLFSGVAGLDYMTMIEPGWLEIKQVGLKLPSLPSAFSGFRIAQISDIHMGGWMNRKRLSDVVQNIVAQSPDLVVLTGDFVVGHNWHIDRESALSDLAEKLGALVAKYPTLAVLGNHDYWFGANDVREMLATSGVREIGNDVFTLEKNSAQFHIAGLDDAYDNHDRMDIVLKKLSGKNASVLLVHEPDFADRSAATGRFDLQISGHSHGGQVVLPFLGPPILPFLGMKYPSGLYRIPEMWQYTNRGVGMSKPYVRFNCRPELTVFTLKTP